MRRILPSPDEADDKPRHSLPSLPSTSKRSPGERRDIPGLWSPIPRYLLRDDRQRLKATNDRCGAPLQFVSRTGEAQIGQASQQATERDLGLHPRQMRADAKVNAISKRKMRIGLAGYVQPIGLREFLSIPVGEAMTGKMTSPRLILVRCMSMSWAACAPLRSQRAP